MSFKSGVIIEITDFQRMFERSLNDAIDGRDKQDYSTVISIMWKEIKVGEFMI